MVETPARERKAAERARKLKAGLVRYDLWCTPKERKLVLELLAKLRSEK